MFVLVDVVNKSLNCLMVRLWDGRDGASSNFL